MHGNSVYIVMKWSSYPINLVNLTVGKLRECWTGLDCDGWLLLATIVPENCGPLYCTEDNVNMTV